MLKVLSLDAAQVADPPFGTYWNYLRRQLFVMDTYASAHNQRVNHTMLALHCYLSWAIVIPLFTGEIRALSLSLLARTCGWSLPCGSTAGRYLEIMPHTVFSG